MYGAALEEFKELVNICHDDHNPMLIGGNFNIFIITKTRIKTILTMANRRVDSTYEKLERALATTNWNFKFPLVLVWALERIKSLLDHAPLLIDFVPPSCQAAAISLSSSLVAHQRGLSELIKKVWDMQPRGRMHIQQWNYKITAMRRSLCGWAKHIAGLY